MLFRSKVMLAEDGYRPAMLLPPRSQVPVQEMTKAWKMRRNAVVSYDGQTNHLEEWRVESCVAEESEMQLGAKLPLNYR